MKAHAQISIGNAFLPNNSVFRGSEGTFGTLVSKILPLFYLTGSVLTAVYFIFGAVQFIYSRGDAKAKEAAKNKIQYAVLGFALVVLSFLLVQFLGKIIPIGPTERGR
jgi:cytochrome bd-type quinol oxidase subunit 2